MPVVGFIRTCITGHQGPPAARHLLNLIVLKYNSVYEGMKHYINQDKNKKTTRHKKYTKCSFWNTSMSVCECVCVCVLSARNELIRVAKMPRIYYRRGSRENGK